jgi:hypothetical protein
MEMPSLQYDLEANTLIDPCDRDAHLRCDGLDYRFDDGVHAHAAPPTGRPSFNSSSRSRRNNRGPTRWAVSRPAAIHLRMVFWSTPWNSAACLMLGRGGRFAPVCVCMD